MKLHEALKEALMYLEMAERNPSITVDMRTWFDWENEDERTRCSVCLAGAYFCKGIVNPELSFDAEEGTIYDVIDELRCGDVERALRIFGVFPEKQVPNFKVCWYADNPVRFKREMNEISEYLESNNY